MRDPRYVSFAALTLVIAVYVALRFWDLTASCLWFDEIFSIHAAEHSWNTLFSFVADDLIHPPLFYVLLKLWINAGAESLLWLRLFPVVFAIISLLPFLFLCREFKLNLSTQTLALFFLATNGSLIKYSQEVRMYSVLLCLSLFSMWLFVRYFAKGTNFVPLVLINLLLIYTHYFGWLVIATEVVVILIFQRIKWRRAVLMFAVLFVCFAPWAYAVRNAALGGSELGQNVGWIARPGLWAIYQFALDLIEPIYYQATSIEPASIYRVSLPILLIIVIVLSLYFANRKQQDDIERQNIKLLALFAGVPLLTALALSWILPHSVWGTRHLIVVFPPFAILLAITISSIPSQWLKTAAITLIVLFSGYAFVLQASRPASQYSWCVWSSLVADAATEQQANIYTFEDQVAYNIWFAERNQKPSHNVFKVNGIDGLEEDKAYFLPRGFNGVATITFDEIADEKLWIAHRSKTLNPNEPPLRNFTVKGYRVVNQCAAEATGESAFLILLEK